MLKKPLIEIARSITLASMAGRDPAFLMGIRYAAHQIADDHCTAGEKFHFLLLCGVEFNK